MGEYHNDFNPTATLLGEWSEQEVSMPLFEVVRLYVHEAAANVEVDAEVAKLRAENDELRKRWLEEFSRRENAEAERKELQAIIDKQLEGGE